MFIYGLARITESDEVGIANAEYNMHFA